MDLQNLSSKGRRSFEDPARQIFEDRHRRSDKSGSSTQRCQQPANQQVTVSLTCWFAYSNQLIFRKQPFTADFMWKMWQKNEADGFDLRSRSFCPQIRIPAGINFSVTFSGWSARDCWPEFVLKTNKLKWFLIQSDLNRNVFLEFF